jgi:hypothetical protein
MATVTGTLKNVLEVTEVGQVTVQLCGYGSSVPRANGIALYGSVSTQPTDIPIPGTGAFTFTVTGNDEIVPAGTYYTVTIADDNGDIVQVNAYLFLGNNTYDLNVIDPFDPSQPLPPLPPLIINQLLLIAPFTPTPNFPGDTYTAWGFQLTGDVMSSTLSGIVAGNLYTFIITQGAGGGWTFVWPNNVLGAMPIDPGAGSVSIQTFVAIANDGPLLPIAAGTWYHA